MALSRFEFRDALRPRRRRAFTLASIDPASTPYSSGDKAKDRFAVQSLAAELDALQNVFYADKRYKLLVVLQGTDTSGKDGTIRSVFGQMSALGVHAIGWKAPSEIQRSHDFLWRIHQHVPGDGEIALFNRSHYEDVLVPVVGGAITPEQTARRYAQINDFERMLSENGTVILKFLLHLSKDEQRRRLQERLADPTKRWKFAPEDLATRKHWNPYQAAYSAAVDATGTPWAPWIIVPSDSKVHRNLMIATLVRQSLLALKLRYPDDDPSLKNIKVA